MKIFNFMTSECVKLYMYPMILLQIQEETANDQRVTRIIRNEVTISVVGQPLIGGQRREAFFFPVSPANFDR